jgi:hypothetical protein
LKEFLSAFLTGGRTLNCPKNRLKEYLFLGLQCVRAENETGRCADQASMMVYQGRSKKLKVMLCTEHEQIKKSITTAMEAMEVSMSNERKMTSTPAPALKPNLMVKDLKTVVEMLHKSNQAAEVKKNHGHRRSGTGLC